MNKQHNLNMTKILRVGIYLRLSDEDKDKVNKLDDSESIKNQRNLLLAEISKHPNFLLIDEYCDENLSGAGTYRPAFERLINDCQNNKLDIVLCKSQSRFSRDMEVIEKYLHNKFIEWNIRFIGLSDNTDTENKGNKKARQINGLVNEWYLEDISNNIRSAFYSKMKQGEFISPFAAFGYEISKENNNKLIIDQFASNIVKKIYNLYLNGFGYTKIAHYLNNKNIPSPSLYKYQKGCKLNIVSNRPREEIKWTPNAIKTILTNEVYLGHLVQGKRTTVSYKNHKIIKKTKENWIKSENVHEAIIDKKIFNKVKKTIKERTKPLKKSGKVHIFSGKVFCLECNSYMRKKNSQKHEYLVCSNSNCPNKTSIRYDVLKDIILNYLNKKINKFYDLEILKTEYNNFKNYNYSSKLNYLTSQKKILLTQLSTSTNYLKNLYEDKVNNIITISQFQELSQSYTLKKSHLKEQLINLNNEINACQNKLSFENINEILNEYRQIKQLTKVIVDEFIEKICLGKINHKINTRDIQILWNFKE